MKREEKLPRGLHRRGDSIIAVFAVKKPGEKRGKIIRRSLGDVSVG